MGEQRAERQDASAEPPAVGVPAALPGAGHIGILSRAFEKAVDDFKDQIKWLETRVHSNHNRLLLYFGAGFILLASMIIGSYHWLDDKITSESDKIGSKIDKADDRIVILGSDLSRVDQQLKDLLERIPPVATPPPKRQ